MKAGVSNLRRGADVEHTPALLPNVNHGAPHAEVERSDTFLTPFEPNGTLIAVVEMSLMSWLVVAGGGHKAAVIEDAGR
jgi:hypothetical protein